MGRTHDVFEDIDNEDIIYLTGEDGTECRFQLLDYIDYNQREFIVLLSEEEAAKEESTVDILEVVPLDENPEQETYVVIEEDEIFNAVFDLFMANNEDNMEFC